MDVDFEITKKNPLENAGFLSKITFAWLFKFYKQASKQPLQVEDLFQNSYEFSSKELGDRLETVWMDEICNSRQSVKKPKFSRVLRKLFLKQYLIYTFSLFLDLFVFRTMATFALSILINLFSESEVPEKWTKYTFGAIYCVTVIVFVICNEYGNYNLSLLGIKIRVATTSIIYRKLLKLNQTSLGNLSAGKIVNLLSNDINILEISLKRVHNIIVSPLTMFLITYLSWREVGVACLAGVFFIILLTMPIQAFIGKTAASLRLSVTEKTDKRTKLMNEIVSGIKVIKMYAWEKPFENLVKLVRSQEISLINEAIYLSGISFNFHALIQKIAIFLIIVVIYFINETISAANVFSILLYFNILRFSMVLLFPLAVFSIAEVTVSIKRIEDFLLQEEVTSYVDKSYFNSEILLENVQAAWTSNSQVLKLPYMDIPNGKLCVIIGPVGSGKSSLLQLLLGELLPSVGRVKLNGKISYCSQDPWLFSSSVRNNIIFGQKFNYAKYLNVIKACNLDKDFKQLPNGDECLVGERGVILSGGQRARINLARAIYKDSDIYLLDDPLSAVDSRVGRHLFEECVVKYLREKTRILITHQLQYIKDADVIYILSEGKIEAEGTFEELSSRNTSFTQFLTQTFKKEDNLTMEKIKRMSISKENEFSLIKDIEEIPTKINPFREYLKAGGNICYLMILILFLVIAQISYTFADYLLIFWTKNESEETIFAKLSDNQTNNTINETDVDKKLIDLTDYDTLIILYSVVTLLSILFTIIRIVVMNKFVNKASIKLHKKMFNALLKAPMKFFNNHPSGRILNRFSKDVGTVDQKLPLSFLEASQLVLLVMGGFVLLIVTDYYIVVFILLFLAATSVLFVYFSRISAHLKHLEGITKSPVFSHINYSLLGLATIRANRCESILANQFDSHQDAHTSADFLCTACSYGFCVWMDFLCIVLNTCVTFALIIINDFFYKISDTYVGLALSQTMVFNVLLSYGIRNCADCVNEITSVERILAYTKLDEEEPEEAKGRELKQTWPCFGEIEFVNVSLSYNETDKPVLKNLTFHIKPRQKIGIVGRTGAGKSSLISTIFRLTPFDGKIIIDGIDINEIELKKLRQKISIIPQEPVLFSDTVRYNIDPFKEYTDSEIWNAIQEVEMKESIESLDFVVTEGGSNFSIGQRQLLCLARAVLRKNKILVLDEATANVDLKTDELIQSTIKRKFYSCTVITIAHRLNTIMDSDKVLVLDKGDIVEYNHPYLLLKNESGIFHSLVKETGSANMQELKRVAYNDYLSKVKI